MLWHGKANQRSDAFEGEVVSGGVRQPVGAVEGAAHAQRQRRDIQQLVGGHALTGFGVDLHSVHGQRLGSMGLLGLVSPFRRAKGGGTGYRKE